MRDSVRRGVRLVRVLAGIACLLSLSRSVWSQDLRYLRHQAWSTEEGLPQDSVHQIVQTADGFLWIATEAGIARFDGVSFKVLGRLNQPAFVSDDACCLAAGANGALWIGTAEGAVLYQDGRFTRYAEQDGLPSSSIRALSLLADGTLLVSTAAGQAVWKDGRFTPSAPARPEESLVRDVGTKAVSASYAESSPARSTTASWSFSTTVVTVRDGTYSHQWKVGVDLPGSRVETVFVDRQGVAWVGTNSGLATLTERAAAAQPVPWLEGNVVLQVYQDREGNYWIGSETSGLHVLRRTKFRTEPKLANQAVTALTESGDATVWIGTRRGGLQRLRGGDSLLPVASAKLTSPVILSLAPGPGGSVWVGTPDGLNAVQADGSVRRVTSADGLPDDYIQALAADGTDGVWVGTRHGLVHLHGRAIDVLSRANGLPGDLIGALLRTQGGDLWIATLRGLTRRAVDGTFRSYALPAMDGVAVVSALAEGPAGDVWVGTSKGGLSRVQNGDLRTLPSLRGAPQIEGLAVDGNGFLWLRNRNGIDRLPLADLDRCFAEGHSCAPRTNHYGLPEGLPSVEVVPGGSPLLWRMRNGELWFATRRGLAITDPDHLSTNAVSPPVVIERLLADERVFDLATQPLQIPFGPVRFTIEYAGLSYTAPSEVRYRYKLEGLEPDWTDAGARRSATYTNLRPREYRFRVQAMNNDGVWSEAGATLSFRVVPPFYRRAWFLALLALILAAIIAGLYRLRLRRLERQFGLVLKERNRMAREIHDTLAQDFVGVSLQLDIISQLLGLRRVEAAIQQVGQTRKLVTDGLAEARRSIWELRANLAEGSLPTRLAKVVERYETETLRVALQIGGAYRKLDGRLEDEVLRIAQEALSNVQRHSGAKEARVDLRYENDMLRLTVEDGGRGFVPAEVVQAGGRFGVRGMQERASSVGATLALDSSAESGTRVRLLVPIPNAAVPNATVSNAKGSVQEGRRL